MDGVAITHWIKVIVGILDFVERGNPVELMNLLLVTHRAEKWEKQGDGHDHIREKKVGPILADEEFTIIHLLHYIGLPEQALYYEDKWYKHEIPRLPQIQHEPRVFWEYETTMKLGSSEYKLAQLSRELWEDLQKSQEASRFVGVEGIDFDPDHPSWPSHGHDPPSSYVETNDRDYEYLWIDGEGGNSDAEEVHTDQSSNLSKGAPLV